MGPDASRRRSDTPPRVLSPGASAPSDVAATRSLADDLLPLAISDPSAASEKALKVIASVPGPGQLSVAHQALAIVHRDRGRMELALEHGFAALRQSRRVGLDRQADVLATLAVVLAYAGRSDESLRRFAEAIPITPPRQLPRLFLRRAHVLVMLTRYREAVDDATRAIGGLNWNGDRLWEARALNNRFDALLALGETEAAEADAARAEELFRGLGQDWETAQSVHNRALAAHQRGDLPEALTLLDRATDAYVALGNVRHDLMIDKVETLLTAGLSDEARHLAATTLSEPELAPVRRAELLLVSARAALAAGQPEVADPMADEAARLFADQQRPAWRDRALLLRLRARHVVDHPEMGPWWIERGDAPSRERLEQGRHAQAMVRDSAALVESMRRSGAAELPVALVLHGRISDDAGADASARIALQEAAATRRTGPPLARAAGWLAAALLAVHDEDQRALYLACRRGLDAVDEHRSILGDVELRALASGHGIEFTRLAVREATRSGRPRQLLWWAERWRAAALDAPVPDGDPDQRRDLAALRDVTRRLDETGADDPAAVTLARDQARLEAAIRRRHRHQRLESAALTSPRRSGPVRFDLKALFTTAGEDTAVVSIVRDGSTLHRLTVCRGVVRHHVVGSSARASTEADFSRLALRRAAHGRRVDLAATGRALEEVLLGGPLPLPAGVGRVVVVPPAELLTAPWGLMPSFVDIVLSVSPSVAQWTRARSRPEEAVSDHVALVTGPGLSTREAEVVDLRRVHRHAKVLPPDGATAAAALEAIDGAALAHIAAHGTFRADAPLFSALHLADGPLTVHDLRGLRHPPRAIVLSACDSGGAAPIGPYEALGLVTSLLGTGTASVLASVVPVNDAACLHVMAAVHRRLASAPGTLADGWLAARRATAGDPLAAATAASFTAWGA